MSPAAIIFLSTHFTAGAIKIRFFAAPQTRRHTELICFQKICHCRRLFSPASKSDFSLPCEHDHSPSLLICENSACGALALRSKLDFWPSRGLGVRNGEQPILARSVHCIFPEFACGAWPRNPSLTANLGFSMSHLDSKIRWLYSMRSLACLRLRCAH
ncbi:hypothetical protein B0H15DRAFT_840231 [Mycena belliarum]|uniref:Uncharacterized protein n=1 Tax=Mycena belliarum TaxID=1033014 RepID=A0AAD6XS92_9AGAR|nr:hypothetical protein B0H15DRAFT_840231 [Mycena belliae]